MRAVTASVVLIAVCLVGLPAMAQGSPSEQGDSSESDDEGDDEDEDNDDEDAPEPLPTLTAGGRIVVPADPLFQGASPEPSQRGYELCRAVRAAMAGFTGKVTITVHWSKGSGDRAWTLAASKRRAQKLADAIAYVGIPASRVVVVGAGFDKPIASNDTYEGQVQNRRVEIVSDRRAKVIAPKVEPAPKTTPSPEPAPSPERTAPKVETPAPRPEIGEPNRRVEAKLQQAVRLAEGFRDALKKGARDCPGVSRATVKWARADGKTLSRLGDEITHIFDHELNYQYTAAQQKLLQRYSQAAKAGVASLEACGESGGLTEAAVAAFEDVDMVDDLLYEATGRNADAFCRRLSELQRAVRDEPETLKGKPVDGGFSSARGLPGTTCEFIGPGVLCEVVRARSVVEAAEPYVALEARMNACHFSREENEMDQLYHRPGARNQRVWLHSTGTPGQANVTCALRLVPTLDGGYRIVVLVDRTRF